MSCGLDHWTNPYRPRLSGGGLRLRPRLFMALSAALTVSAGCSRPIEPPPEKPIRPLKFYQSEAGQYGPSPVPLRMVIHDPGTLAQMHLGHLKVDFSRQMVLLACMGRVPSSGYQIRITAAWQRGRKVHVYVRTSHDPAGDQRRDTAPRPYYAVVVDRVDENVEGFSAQVPHGRIAASPYAR